MKELDNYIDMLESYLNLNIDDFLGLNRYAIKNILDLLKENKKLKNKIERLKNRLDIAQVAYLSVNEKNNKAIEYLKENGIDNKMLEECGIWDVNGIKLFKILKGVDIE